MPAWRVSELHAGWTRENRKSSTIGKIDQVSIIFAGLLFSFKQWHAATYKRNPPSRLSSNNHSKQDRHSSIVQSAQLTLSAIFHSEPSVLKLKDNSELN
jgi:hypothetical protein